MFDLTLSFDNGPEPEVTPHVLDTLRKRGIKATFFVIGEKLTDPERRRLSVWAHDEGHWIGNHTYTHSVPLGQQADPAAAEHEIDRTQEVIGDLAHPQRWFRPFGGGGNLDARLLKPSVVDHLCKGGYSCVLWSAVPRDWSDPDGWSDRALVEHLEQAQDDATTVAIRNMERGGIDIVTDGEIRRESYSNRFATADRHRQARDHRRAVRAGNTGTPGGWKDPTKPASRIAGYGIPSPPWAAGSAFFFLQAMLGLQPNALGERLYVDPELPEWLPDLTDKRVIAADALAWNIAFRDHPDLVSDL